MAVVNDDNQGHALIGRSPVDTIFGNGDDDAIHGEALQDKLGGGAGNDVIVGGAQGARSSATQMKQGPRRG
ncbi:MAG TPA: hypothetical protein PKA13_14240 [Geminicoccaceae bacterium]|nr:hypothetical protein [Geminicoccus sp.]HMU50929.1 hypothetical protein [Geminicoccaceae bacterium]